MSQLQPNGPTLDQAIDAIASVLTAIAKGPVHVYTDQFVMQIQPSWNLIVEKLKENQQPQLALADEKPDDAVGE